VQLVAEGDPAVSQLAHPSKWSKRTKLGVGAAALAAPVAAALWISGAVGAPASHEVIIRMGGDLGTVARIVGAPGGDTGPISVNTDTTTERRFVTDKATDDLGLVVTVTPPGDGAVGSAHCLILVDGKAVAMSRKSSTGPDWVCSTTK
jgi:hypothetical protein